MTPQDTIARLLDHLEETLRLFAEGRDGLAPNRDGELIDVLHECEQLTRNQVRMLTRARKRCG